MPGGQGFWSLPSGSKRNTRSSHATFSVTTLSTRMVLSVSLDCPIATMGDSNAQANRNVRSMYLHYNISIQPSALSTPDLGLESTCPLNADCYLLSAA